jgi:8-oxo-dGTP pyrophosphatase MutT (NUDIX family)
MCGGPKASILPRRLEHLMSDPLTRLDRALHDYAAQWPAECEAVTQFLQLLARGDAAFRRDCLPGHFTGSAWLVSADGARVLLTHHRKLDRWLQLGGHADGDTDSARVALREAQEESGLAGLRPEGGLFDIDRHLIPARAAEPAHWHFDLRYVVRADDETFVVSDESHALAWRPVAALFTDPQADASMQRMARKWLSRTDEHLGSGARP